METNWLNNPLVVSTRPKGKSEDIKKELHAKGVRFVENPFIKIEPTTSTILENSEIASYANYDWLVFTSANGVHCFFSGLKGLGLEYKKEHQKIACIGSITKAAVLKHNEQVDFVSPVADGVGFINSFKSHFGKTPSVLWPTGNLSPHYLEHDLLNVYRIEVYSTSIIQGLDPQIEKAIEGNHGVVFLLFSPSAVDGLVKSIAHLKCKANIRLACIGKVTQKRCEDYGLTVSFVSSKSKANKLLELVLKKIEI